MEILAGWSKLKLLKSVIAQSSGSLKADDCLLHVTRSIAQIDMWVLRLLPFHSSSFVLSGGATTANPPSALALASDSGLVIGFDLRKEEAMCPELCQMWHMRQEYKRSGLWLQP